MVNYLRNRILPIYSLNVLFIVVYTFLKLLVGKEFTMVDLVMSFGFGKTIVQFGWYLQVCMLFYLLFYVSFKWIKQAHCGNTNLLFSNIDLLPHWFFDEYV